MNGEIHSGHVVPSISIENLVRQRQAVLERIEKIVALTIEAQQLASAAGVGMPTIGLMTGYNRAECRINGSYKDELPKCVELCRKEVDRGAWAHLMNESGLRTLMDATARKKWDDALEKDEFPELTAETIESTFQTMHASRGDMFERGVIACFKGLSWCYKTNKPFLFGKRIILRGLSYTYSRKPLMMNFNQRTCDELDDLVRVLTILDGKPEPDHRNGMFSALNHAERTKEHTVETEYLSVKWFIKGTGHVTFKRLDLVDRMNDIIAKHYPGALPWDQYAAA